MLRNCNCKAQPSTHGLSYQSKNYHLYHLYILLGWGEHNGPRVGLMLLLSSSHLSQTFQAHRKYKEK